MMTIDDQENYEHHINRHRLKIGPEPGRWN